MRLVLLGLALLPAVATGVPTDVAGRWRGFVDIPGRPLPLVVDLARDGAGGWAGSIILPTLGVKGAPLSHLGVEGDRIVFDLGALLATAAYGPAAVTARVGPDGAMAGEMRQAGNVAPMTLARIGGAQVEAAVRSTPVADDLAHVWRGDFDLGGYPRHVTLAFENHAGAAATATLVIVGKATTTVPVDLVVQQDASVRVEARSMGVAFEGRVEGGGEALSGTIEIGPAERPLVLRRATRRRPS